MRHHEWEECVGMKMARSADVLSAIMANPAGSVGPMNGKLGIYAAEAARNLFLPIHRFIPSI